MKRRERGKVEARVEICWGPIKKPGWREDGRGEEVEGREGGRKGQGVEKVAARREGWS